MHYALDFCPLSLNLLAQFALLFLELLNFLISLLLDLLFDLLFSLLHSLNVSIQHLDTVSLLCYFALKYNDLLLGLIQLLGGLGRFNLDLIFILGDIIQLFSESSFVSLSVLFNCFKVLVMVELQLIKTLRMSLTQSKFVFLLS